MDKHKGLLYKCVVDECSGHPGFASIKGLNRHRNEVHGDNQRTVHYCPHVTCERHKDQPFLRASNLARHISSVHPVGNLGTGGEPIIGRGTNVASDPEGKKPRKFKWDDDSEDDNSGQLKRPRTSEEGLLMELKEAADKFKRLSRAKADTKTVLQAKLRDFMASTPAASDKATSTPNTTTHDIVEIVLDLLGPVGGSVVSENKPEPPQSLDLDDEVLLSPRKRFGIDFN